MKLDSIVEAGHPTKANRTFAVIRKMFNFAVERDILPTTPCTGITTPAREHQRDRVLNSKELKRFFEYLPKCDMMKQTKLALQFLLATAQRPGEVISVEWKEIDIKSGWWEMPSEKAKNRRAHRVPLSPFAISLLIEAKKIKASKRWVFPSPRVKNTQPMVKSALARSVRRNEKTFKIDHFTPHDLRRTAASHMTSLGFNRLIVSKILNHVENSVTAIYDRYSYEDEKRDALTQWGEKLSEAKKRFK